jgi:hypothetical protein
LWFDHPNAAEKDLVTKKSDEPDDRCRVIIIVRQPPERPGVRRIRQGSGVDMSTSDAIPEGRHDSRRKGNGSRPGGEFLRALLAGAIALSLLLPGAGFAEEPPPPS